MRECLCACVSNPILSRCAGAERLYANPTEVEPQFTRERCVIGMRTRMTAQQALAYVDGVRLPTRVTKWAGHVAFAIEGLGLITASLL